MLIPKRIFSTLALCIVGGTLVAACSSGGSSKNAVQVPIALTSDGCSPSAINAKAGPTTFVVTNNGASGVTELEVLDNDHIIGEVENITSGLTGKFTLNLRAGNFVLYCPGGKTAEKGTLTVTGDSTNGGKNDPDLDAAVLTYREYVTSQMDQLVAATKSLREAVASNDVATSKQRYIVARPFYERIEPIAESFGDLDPAIDERADDVKPEALTGFHRIEYALWTQNTTQGMTPVADQLIKDVTKLQSEIPGLDIDAVQTANGAVDLLGEVTASKITGEEERYSHIDVLDFHANVEGAKAAFDAVRAALARRDPALATTVDTRFEAVFTALMPYQRGDSYVSYTELTDADKLKLGQVIDALGEPISQVAEALTKDASQ